MESVFKIFENNALLPIIIIIILIFLIVIGILLSIKFMKRELFLANVEDALKSKNYKKAVRNALLYLNDKEGNLLLYYYLGKSYEGLSQYRNALESYEKALACIQNDTLKQLEPEILLRLGFLYQKINKFDESIGYYKTLLKINPNNSIALWNLAEMYYNQNKIPPAKNYVDKLISVKSNHEKAYLLSAKIYNHLGQYEQSIKHIESFYKLNDEQSLMLNNETLILLADNYMALKRYNDVFNTLKPLLNEKQINGVNFLKIILSLIYSGSFKKAVKLMSDYLMKIPVTERCSILYQAGNAYLAMDEIYSALDSWKSCYDINPKYLDLAVLLKKYDALRKNPWLENIFSSKDEVFEASVIKKFRVYSSESTLERQKDFFIFKQEQICIVVFRHPFPIPLYIFNNIQDILKNFGYSNLSVDIYTLFSFDETSMTSPFYKRIREISGDAFISKFKPAQI